MHRLARVVSMLALGVAVAALTSPSPALARSSSKVEWSSVVVPDGEGSKQLARTLRDLLQKAARKADFGKGRRVVVSARLVELSTTVRGGVLRVRCTMVGRLAGGPSAKSRISFGGDPSQRAELEKQVLTMVTGGLVTRLAEMARTRAAADDIDEE